MNEQPSTTGTNAALPDWKGFKVLQEVTRTPRGIVYKLRRKVEQDVIAAKFFEPSSCRKEFLEALPQTSERAFLLSHKGLVRCLGCALVERRPLLMLEFAAGEPLSVLLKTGQPLLPARALLAILQCATALRHAALQGQTHGRLHPADILIGEDNARIVGVGLGERPDHATWSSPHPYAFEPLVYVAPEAMPSQTFPEALDVRAAVDIYALGAMLAHLLTGTPPFAGRDEASLVDERRMIGKPVQWPSDAEKRVPKQAREITERMLSSGAGLRPTYDELLTKLTAAVAEAEKFQNAAELGINSTSALFAPVGSTTGTGSALMSAMTTAVVPPAPVPRPRTNRLYTTALIAMTACVFLLALALAAKIFLYDPLLAEGTKSVAAKEAVTPVAPVAQPPQPAQTVRTKTPDVPEAPVSLNTAEYAVATRQLEVIQELLKDGEIKHTPALRRRVMSIADKAGRDTPVGVKALLLSDEIEESINGPKVNSDPKKPLTATELPVIPGVGTAGSAMPEKARPETAPAVAAQGNPPVPTTAAPVQPVTSAVVLTPPATALNGAGEPVTTATPVAAPTADQKHKEFMDALRKAMELARAFKYPELNTELGRLNAIAVADDQKLATNFSAIVKEEQSLVNRCRARLIEQIQRHPRHESPLQVFPRKNDPQGDDIIDFDDNGLKIAQRKPGGAAPVVTLKSWERIPPAQALALVSLLAPERSNVEDQLGIAAFAFNRGLSNELETALNNARGIPAAKDRAEQFADRVKALGRVLDK